jgi:chloride channel protein, CIC family
VKEVADHVTRGEPDYIRHQAFPIVNEQKLVGIVTWGDILETLTGNMNAEKTVLEVGNDEPVVTYPDELLHDAVSKMLRNDVGRLPVVDRHSPHKLVGYLGRAAVMEARLGRLHEEHVLETGWLKPGVLPKISSIFRRKYSRTQNIPEED